MSSTYLFTISFLFGFVLVSIFIICMVCLYSNDKLEERVKELERQILEIHFLDDNLIQADCDSYKVYCNLRDRVEKLEANNVKNRK